MRCSGALLATALGTAAGQHLSCKYKGADFSPLNKAGTGHQIEVPQGLLHINPCAPVDACKEVNPPASCCLQTNFSTSTSVSCGEAFSGLYTTDLADPDLTIGMIQTHGSECGYILEPEKKMQLTIAFECDKDTPDPGVLTFNDEGHYCNYNITWKTRSACQLPRAPNRPSSLANDWGSHFLLIFVAVFVTYCGLGTFIKSRLPNHSDACYNNIPQRDFWFDLPSLVSDGAIFAVSLGERKANKHGTYESIDSDKYGSTDDATKTETGDDDAAPKE